MQQVEERPEEAGDELVERHRGLFARTLLVAGLTLGSRILGYVRDVLSAMLFGEGSAVLDAWVTAWRVPNLFRRLFGEGALSTSLQTSLTRADGDAGRAGGAWLFQRTLWVVALLLTGLVAVGMGLVAVMPDTMPVTGWSWLGTDPAPVRDLTVRLLPFVVVICLAALAGGALNVRGHYALPNVAPALMNLLWVGALVVLLVDRTNGAPLALEEEWELARVIAWVVLLGGALQLAIQLPGLLRTGLLDREPRPEGVVDTPRGVLTSALPLAFGAAVYQVNVMLDGLMAEGLLSDGGPTAHYLANRIQQFPMALIAIAATSAVFPSLNALAHRGRRAELRALFDKTQLAIAFLSVPATAGLLVLAGPIASLLFEHGDYGARGAARIGAALTMLAVAMPATGAGVLVVRTYYAQRDFRTPVAVSVVTLVANVLLNVLFVAVVGMDVEGLALSTAITSWTHLAILFVGLRRKLDLPGASVAYGPRLARIVGAALACGGAAWAVERALGAQGGVLATLAAIGAGSLAYAVGVFALGSPEARDLRRRLTRR